MQFLADPIRRTSFPLGALVEDEAGRIAVEPMDFLPDANCLGGSVAAATMRLAQADLKYVDNLEDPALHLLGPHTILEPVRLVPSDVADSRRWVRNHVLLDGSIGQRDERHRQRPVRRATFGQRFFQRYGVQRYVKRRFHASRLGTQLKDLKNVSHFVEGNRKLLLMEPLVPQRKDFERDARQVKSLFASYRFFLDRMDSPEERDVEFIAFMLRGGRDEERSFVADLVESSAHRVVDVQQAHQREEFIEAVRAVGASVVGSTLLR